MIQAPGAKRMLRVELHDNVVLGSKGVSEIVST